jgi:hypothetical protein
MMHKIAAGIFLITAGVARANLIVNPSFETPVVPDAIFVIYPSGSAAIPGWTVTGPAGTGVALVNNMSFINGVPLEGVTFKAFDGVQSVDMTGVGSNNIEGISQTVATAIGTNYILTFYIGNTTGGVTFGTTSTDALKINGNEVALFSNVNVSATNLNWVQYTYNFTATTATTTIGFENRDPGSDNSNFLDLVSLEVGGPGGSTVPEPATLGMVAVALATLAARRRS